jgi:hypothetical protein
MAQKEEMAIEDNLNRRQMTAKEKKALFQKWYTPEKERSSTQSRMKEIFGVTQGTISNWLRDIKFNNSDSQSSKGKGKKKDTATSSPPLESMANPIDEVTEKDRNISLLVPEASLQGLRDYSQLTLSWLSSFSDSGGENLFSLEDIQETLRVLDEVNETLKSLPSVPKKKA